MERQTALYHRSDRGIQAWSKAVSDAFFTLDADSATEGKFLGDLASWSFGPLAITRLHSDGVRYRRVSRHLRDDSESAILITIPSRSDLEFHQFSRSARTGPGGFVIERSDAPYEFIQRQRDRVVVVKLPAETVAARIGDLNRFTALSVDARGGIASYFLSALRHATDRIETLDDGARDMIGTHLVDLLCLTLTQEDRVLDSQGSLAVSAHLYRAEEVIRKNLKNPALTPGRVAEECGVSLRYLQKIFAGTERTVSGCIRKQRLARCHEDLKRPAARDTIASIAYRWGFSDQAQFGRQYRQQYGCTPRDTRTLARTGG